jgi:hypothetical protein
VIDTAKRLKFFASSQIPFKRMVSGFVFILLAAFIIYAGPVVSISQSDDDTYIVEDAPEQQIISFGKNVIIKKQVKEVLAVGGNVIIEGHVKGDVGVIGGNITQKENAFIGGDVIVFGGSYTTDSKTPLRNADKETVVMAVLEDEVRNYAQNPSQIFAPSLSWSFMVHRILSILFWFVISLALTTISPGAVSRGVTRIRLSTLKVFAVGSFAFVITLLAVAMGISFLPTYLSAIVALMALILLFLSYVFGRVALQVIIGKMVQKQLLPDKMQSETVALLIGVIIWSIFLSIPYLWVLTLLTLFAASLGLVLTARGNDGWRRTKEI